MKTHGGLAALAALALVACAPEGGGSTPGSAGAQAATAPSPFDGDWRGSGRLISRGSASCAGETINHTMRVRNGQAQLDYDPRAGIRFAGAVAPDGTLQMQSGARIFRGQFAGNTFTGDYFHPACPRSWTMQRVNRPGG